MTSPGVKTKVVRKLECKVVCANDLKSQELIGDSDPYVIVECGFSRKKTKAIDNNLDPVWNKDFEFDVEDNVHELFFTIFDKNRFQADVFMAYGVADLNILEKDKLLKKTITLRNGNGHCGTLTLELKALYATLRSATYAIEENFHQLTAEHEKAKNELIEKSILVKNLNTKVTEMDSQLAILKKVAENSKQNEVTIDASKLQQQLDQFNEEIKLLNNENAKLSINSEEFQKCLKDLTENNSLIKKSTLLQEESSKLITKSHESKESLIILKEDNQKLLHQYQDFKREYDVFKTENEQLNSKFSEMDSKIIALTQEVNDKNASITELAEKNDSLVVEKREIEDNIITLQREVDQLKFEKSRTTEDNEDLSKRIEALKAENTSFEEKLDKLKSENVELQENIKKLSDSLFNICQENSKLSESNNSTLKQIIDLNEQNLRISSQYTQELEVVTSMEMKIRKLQKEIDEKENEKENIFSQNEKLESDKGDLEVEKNHLEYQVEDLSKQLAKYKEFFIKMREENIKLSAVRDDFEQLKTSYFVQVEEKMEAMDKSLLEKLAADVELMDNEKGISKSEFNVLINSVPSDLKRKFSTIAEEKFETYDTNNDGIIDQHELSVMVDAIIGKTTSNKGRSMTLDY